jgi:hypothetical protein
VLKTTRLEKHHNAIARTFDNATVWYFEQYSTMTKSRYQWLVMREHRKYTVHTRKRRGKYDTIEMRLTDRR